MIGSPFPGPPFGVTVHLYSPSFFCRRAVRKRRAVRCGPVPDASRAQCTVEVYMQRCTWRLFTNSHNLRKYDFLAPPIKMSHHACFSPLEWDCRCTPLRAHLCGSLCICIHIYLYLSLYISLSIHIYIYVYIYMCIYIYIYIYITQYTYIYIYMHITYTCPRRPRRSPRSPGRSGSPGIPRTMATRTYPVGEREE